MTYSETIEYINSLSKFGTVLGLDNMTVLLKALGSPEKKLNIIHIAGTNGKGSTGAFLEAMLRAKGFRVGRYVSPAVFCYEERFQINGENISKDDLAKYISLVRSTAEGLVSPTVFEVETAAAFCYFENCDYVLMEVGMGGRLDATNAVQQTLRSVITPIAFDHMAYLGNTLGEIAFEKAGIIKQNGTVISAVQQNEAAEVLKKAASEKGASITFCIEPKINADGSFDYKTHKGLKISLKGDYQYKNAALAAEVFESLFDDENAMRSGLENARWAGRFQVFEGKPTFIFDGAHNPQGAAALAKGLEKYRNLVYICGIFADKDYPEMVKICASRAKKVFTVTPPGARGLDAKILRDEFLKYTKDVTAAALTDAIDAAFEMKECCIAVFGSLSFLGDAINYYKSLADRQ